jgi:hypothetical protein
MARVSSTWKALVLIALCSVTTLVEGQDAAFVYTPEELQNAVRLGVQHVVIQAHMDLATLPRLSATTLMSGAVLALSNDASGIYTQSIRVRAPEKQ